MDSLSWREDVSLGARETLDESVKGEVRSLCASFGPIPAAWLSVESLHPGFPGEEQRGWTRRVEAGWTRSLFGGDCTWRVGWRTQWSPVE
jgi:hypothetical protein